MMKRRMQEDLVLLTGLVLICLWISTVALISFPSSRALTQNGYFYDLLATPSKLIFDAARQPTRVDLWAAHPRARAAQFGKADSIG
jgi:hypothetical protein